ncbi:MAG: hypothetical protein ABIP57_14480 [Jatrophihabitantaceae bacterium]
MNELRVPSGDRKKVWWKCGACDYVKFNEDQPPNHDKHPSTPMERLPLTQGTGS